MSNCPSNCCPNRRSSRKSCTLCRSSIFDICRDSYEIDSGAVYLRNARRVTEPSERKANSQGSSYFFYRFLSERRAISASCYISKGYVERLSVLLRKVQKKHCICGRTLFPPGILMDYWINKMH